MSAYNKARLVSNALCCTVNPRKSHDVTCCLHPVGIPLCFVVFPCAASFNIINKGAKYK